MPAPIDEIEPAKNKSEKNEKTEPDESKTAEKKKEATSTPKTDAVRKIEKKYAEAQFGVLKSRKIVCDIAETPIEKQQRVLPKLYIMRVKNHFKAEKKR